MSNPGRFIPGKKSRYTLYRNWVGPKAGTHCTGTGWAPKPVHIVQELGGLQSRPGQVQRSNTELLDRFK